MKTFALIVYTFAFSATAATWVTNRDHSEILFQVPYMGVSELTGRFNEFEGDADFVNGVPEFLNVRIVSGSIDTSNKMRDGHLRGHDFFQSQVHPQITFKSSKIEKTGPDAYKALGELRIKDISRPQVVAFTVSKALKDTWGFETRFVKFKSAVNRKDYKIHWNKTLDGQQFLVGDTVTFWGTFQIQPKNSKTPNSKHMIPDTKEIRERDASRNESAFSRKLRSLINGN